MLRYVDILLEAIDHPRFWLGPDGQVVDLIRPNWYTHAQAIARDPKFYGFTEEEFDGCVNDGRTQPDKLVAIAQNKGWIRVAQDTPRKYGPAINVSANNMENVRRGLRWLEKHGYIYFSAYVEIYKIDETGWVSVDTYYVDEDNYEKFLQGRYVPKQLYGINGRPAFQSCD